MIDVKPRKDGLPLGLALWIVLGGALLIGVVVLMGRFVPAAGPARIATSTGEVMCQQFVTERLEAPSTARFAWGSDRTATANPDGSVTLRSFVDAQNVYGAQVRTRFTCTVMPVPGRGTWRLVALDMP